MKRLFRILLPFAIFATVAVAAQTPETPSYTMRSGGIERTYKLHIPEGLPDGAPLVIVLHGYGGTNNPALFGMNATADRHGFAICYPLGEKDSRGKPGWNVGYPPQEGMKVDDVKFMADLVAHLQKRHNFSRRNVFCCGFSNGGDICYQLASQRPKLFTAMAPVGGLMFEWVHRADRSTAAVPLLEIHGTADRTSYWEGDLEGKGGWGSYISVPMAVNYWAAKAKCTAMQTDMLEPRTPENGHQVFLHRFTGGTTGCEVWLCEIVGGKHKWGDEDIDTGELIWRFFSQYVK